MGAREGGRRPEGGNTKPGFIPLGGRPQTPYLSRLAATHKLSIHPAWRPLTNPVFIPLVGHPQAQYLSSLARTQSRIVHGKIPSPACGGRGSHEKNARIFFMGTREGGRRPEGGNKNPAFMPLGGSSIYAAWQAQYLHRLAGPAVTPLGALSNPESCTETIPSPACGGRWPKAGRGE